ncbi:hypothetical protein [Faecalimicrobium sp. JNUCC 81]
MSEKVMIKPNSIIKYIIIVIFSMIGSIIFYSSKFLGTFPIPVIIPFLLVLIYKEVLSIIIIGSISILVTKLFMPELGYNIVLIIMGIPWLALIAYSGKYVNEYIHEENRLKRLSIIISVVLFMIISVFFYMGLKRDPITYLKSKSVLEEYVNKNYKGKFILKDFNCYTFPELYYTYSIKDKKDGKVYYLSYNLCSKNILDGYQSDKIDQNVESKLINKIISKTNFKKENIEVMYISTGEKYDIDYDLEKNYSKKEIELLDLCLYKDINKISSEEYLYNNYDEFSKGAYEIINALKETDYKYKEIYISSSSSKENYSININNINKVNSLEYIKNNVEIQK